MTNFTANELDQFIGTEHYYKHWLGFVFTDGIKYLADEAKAYWLIDAIGSYQPELRNVEVQFWTLTVNHDKSAVLEMKEDSDLPARVKQLIPWTDFPIESITLYFINKTLHLPSEY